MMEMEDKESTESGSLGVNSEYDSPPPPPPPQPQPPATVNGSLTSGSGSGVVPPQVLNMNMNMNMSMTTTEGAVGMVVVGSGGGGVVGSGGEKKKRGRPRKYDAEGNLTPQYIKAAAAAAAAKAAVAAAAAAVTSPGGGGGGGCGVTPPSGFTITSPPSSAFSSSSSKRGRGRPSGSSGNLQLIASLGELFAHTAGGDFMPHVVTVHTGEDVAGKVYSFVQKGSRGICVLSANGAVSNVTIRQPGSSGGLLTYEGRFEILALTGSYTVSENGGMKSRSGGLSVSLAGPDGRVIGGGIAGSLIAASPIQMVVGSFMPNAFIKHNKRKHHQVEPRMAPVIHSSPNPVSMVRPVSHAPLVNNMTLTQAPQIPMQSHGEVDNSTSNKDMPNSTSTDTSDCNGSEPTLEQRPYPDINLSIPME
ncbi:AT-hook motif nuclear-localized protein 7 [Nicotiana tomentosiformis]|uniref:AT-hook motif nuclear-localized protein 7 n=1 Tax=Nicotiana tomentosiformis TaxID=4098 RepID=UPI00051C06A7|nr:AT-hook motif nuclear-localized protein 7 [Nicotiana tomentosiformis]